MGNLQCREEHVTNADRIYAAKDRRKCIPEVARSPHDYRAGVHEREHISFKASTYKQHSKEDIAILSVANHACMTSKSP